jgi:ribosome silencing factor RsfS/YbeB/iojap
VTKPVLTRADLPPALQRALDLAIDAKAAAPVVLNLTEIAGYTDWALIVSGRSDRHVGGISEQIVTGLKDMGKVPTGSDGLDEHLWDLVDYDDFLVHVFYHPVRKHYDLESMWRDAPRVELNLPQEVMDTSALEGLQPPENMPPFRGGSFGAFPGELGEDEELGEQLPGELPADLAGDDDEEYDDEAAGEEDLDDEELEGEDEDYAYAEDEGDYDDEAAADTETPAESEPASPAAQRRK